VLAAPVCFNCCAIWRSWRCRRRAEAAKSDFLHPVCDSPEEQLPAEVRRCLRFVKSAPLLTKSAEVEFGEARERLSASRLHLGSRGSCLFRRGNAVDPAALLLRRGKGEPKLLLQSSGEEAAHRVPLPTHHTCDFIDGCTLGSLQHRNHRILLRRGLVSDCWSGSGNASIADHS